MSNGEVYSLHSFSSWYHLPRPLTHDPPILIHIVQSVVEGLGFLVVDARGIVKQGNACVGSVETVTPRYAAQCTACVVGIGAHERIVEVMGGVKLNGEGMNFVCMVVQ